jgi:hypothetical protein
MQQISRPYQIALVVLVLAAATWFVAFGHHSSSGSSGGSSASSSAPTASSQPASGSGGSSSGQIYHGSAPGVEGLTKAIAKAHGAVATSEANARQLEQKSAQATSTTPSESGSATASSGSKGSSTSHGAGTATTPKPATHVTRTTHTTTTTHTTAAKHTVTTTHTTTTTHVKAPAKHAAPGKTTAPTTIGAPTVGAPSGQREVEAAVGQGKVALLFFWNPAGSNDRAVRSQVHSVGGSRKGVDVFESSAQNVASYGAITRQMPVYGTPTILIIGPHRTDSLTGLQDTFSIEQAIKEVRAG